MILREYLNKVSIRDLHCYCDSSANALSDFSNSLASFFFYDASNSNYYCIFNFSLLVLQPKIVIGLPNLPIYFFVFLSYVSLIWLINEKDLQNTYTLSVFILYFFVILFTQLYAHLEKETLRE